MFNQTQEIADMYNNGTLVGKKAIVWYGENINKIDGVYIGLVVKIEPLIDRENVERQTYPVTVFDIEDNCLNNIYLEQIFNIIK